MQLGLSVESVEFRSSEVHQREGGREWSPANNTRRERESARGGRETGQRESVEERCASEN